MIYLDNAATAKPCAEAVRAEIECAELCFGNPSSLHNMGVRAEKVLVNSKNVILHRLGKEGELYFTSGATESNNLAIFGTANALKRRGNRVVTTAIEHPSVTEPMKKLREQGFEVVELKPCEHDNFEQAIIDAVDENTVLVSCMAVNNETGFIIDSKKVYSGVKKRFPKCVVHVDGVQGFCKVPISADLISLSAHKIHGLKGVGALYKAKDVRLLPTVYGGGQQGGLRSGTEPVGLIAAFGAAVNAYPENFTYFSELKEHLLKPLEELPGVTFNSKNSVPNIVNFSVKGVRSEIMLHFLEKRGIYVSSGSACSRGKVSSVLSALGLTPAEADSAIRVSFCRDNTTEEIDELIGGIRDGIKRFRR